jgi:hypothetical protein
MKSAILKGLDALLYPEACFLSSGLPKPDRKPSAKPLILRPGSLGELVCADLALQEIGRDSRDFNWLIDLCARPWANFRGIPHLCYEENPIKNSEKVWDRYALVLNTEQFFGLTEAYAIMSRSYEGRLVSFETNRGASWSDSTVPYDWADRHETMEFARLFAAALDLPDVTGPRRPRSRVVPASEPPLVLVAGLRCRSRQLSLDAWAALISQWHEGRPFLISGAPEDAEFVARLTARFKGLAGPYAGPFDEWCEQISRSEEILAMDGDGMQIASFHGVPTLAIFTSSRDRKWHPLGEGSRLLRRHDLPCQPCAKFGEVPPCPNHFACLKLEEIKPTSIW